MHIFRTQLKGLPAPVLLASALIGLFFGLFLLLPLATILREGLQPHILLEALRNPIYVEGLTNALLIALVTTAMVFAIAVPLAVLQDRYNFRGKSSVTALMLLPMILPPFVGAMGFQQIFSQYGAFNALLGHLGLPALDWLAARFWIVCLVEALHLYPILYLNTATALANLDPTMLEAAGNLGAGKWTSLRRITLPLIRPGLFAGGSIVLIWSFTELGTPLMLQYNRVITVQIFNGITELESNPLPYALVVILLVIASGIYAISRLTFGRDTAAGLTKGIAGTTAKQLYGWRAYLPLLPFLALTLAAVLPHLGVLFLSMARDWYGTFTPATYTWAHYQGALSHAFVVPSIINSVYYASLAMLVCMALGLTLAVLTVRWRPPFWQVFDLLAMLPLAIPGIVLAFGYLSMATRYEFLRSWLDPMQNPTVLLVIAYAVRRLPYVMRAAAAGLQQTPQDLELAARNLGASSWQTLRRIVVPLIAANLVVGALFAFSFSMLEVSDSLILAQKKAFFPITRAIYELAQVLGSGSYIACAFGVWAMAFLACTLVVASILLGRKMGAMFRF